MKSPSNSLAWLLLLLECEQVHLLAHKTHNAQDILLMRDTPIFATSSSELQFIRHGTICDTETEMINVRWKVFKFHHGILESEQRSIVADCLYNLFYKGNRDSEKISSWSLFLSVLFYLVLQLTLTPTINQGGKCHWWKLLKNTYKTTLVTNKVS